MTCLCRRRQLGAVGLRCFCAQRFPEARCGCGWCATEMAGLPRCRHNGCGQPESIPWQKVDAGYCVLHRRERVQIRRAQSQQAALRRRPPDPPHRGESNTCALCGTTPLPGRRRSWCGDDCVDTWNLATSAPWVRHQLIELHGRTCWGCGQPADRLDLDHRRPLWSLTDEERTELRWWMPSNLQLLCEQCHKAKTAREAKARARFRRTGVLDIEPDPVEQVPLALAL